MENKRFTTVLVFIALLIIVLPIINYFGSKESKEILQKFKDAIASENYTFYELGKESCYYCEQQKPVLDGLVQNYSLKYEYIDVAKLKSSHLTEIKKLLGIDPSEFGTPAMAVVGKNKVQETIIGLNDEVALAEKLEPYGLISEYGFTDLVSIDYDKYYELIKSKKPVVIVIEKTDCPYCELAKPQLKRASYLTGTKIYSLDIYDAFIGKYYESQATDEQKKIAKKFMSSLSIYEEGIGTPLILIVKNGKVVDSYKDGYKQASVYVDFLKENKLSK